MRVHRYRPSVRDDVTRANDFSHRQICGRRASGQYVTWAAVTQGTTLRRRRSAMTTGAPSAANEAADSNRESDCFALEMARLPEADVFNPVAFLAGYYSVALTGQPINLGHGWPMH
jgi:hypothetical protein